MPVDILNNDNRIINHEADGDRERHEGNVVETEVEQIHGRERAEQRENDGHARNSRGPEIAKEQQDDKNDQTDSQRQRELDVLDGGANGRRAVEDRLNRDPWWNVGRKARELCLDL